MLAALLLPSCAAVVDILWTPLHGMQRHRRGSVLPESVALQHLALALALGWVWAAWLWSRPPGGVVKHHLVRAERAAQPWASPGLFVLSAVLAPVMCLLWLAILDDARGVEDGGLILCLLSLPAILVAGTAVVCATSLAAHLGLRIGFSLATAALLAAGPLLTLAWFGFPHDWEGAWLRVVFLGLSVPCGLVLMLCAWWWGHHMDQQDRGVSVLGG